MRRDIFSAYLFTGSHLLAWAIIMAAVFRAAGQHAFVVLALVQGTIGLLEYTAVGTGPAIIRMAAEALSRESTDPTPEDIAAATEIGEPIALDSGQSHTVHPPSVRAVFANGFAMALLAATVAVFLLIGWQLTLHHWSKLDQDVHTARQLILLVGIATILRLLSDAPGAVLQTSRRIFADNMLLASAETIWAAVTVVGLLLHLPWVAVTGSGLILGAATLLFGRCFISHHHGSGIFSRWWKLIDVSIMRRLLFYGLMVVAAQLADYLYAPMNYILIARFDQPGLVGIYSPAVQVDGGIMALASAVALVLLPRAALAHAAGGGATVRRYYIRGTLGTGAVLILAALVTRLAAPLVIRIWLGQYLPHTVAILTIMLIHTVIGGTGTVGRAILLAIGKVRAFTISVLVAGVVNVILGFIFIYFLHLHLRGVVYATIIAATGRCLIWLPWYVLRSLKKLDIEADCRLPSAT